MNSVVTKHLIMVFAITRYYPVGLCIFAVHLYKKKTKQNQFTTEYHFLLFTL